MISSKPTSGQRRRSSRVSPSLALNQQCATPRLVNTSRLVGTYPTRTEFFLQLRSIFHPRNGAPGEACCCDSPSGYAFTTL